VRDDFLELISLVASIITLCIFCIPTIQKKLRQHLSSLSGTLLGQEAAEDNCIAAICKSSNQTISKKIGTQKKFVGSKKTRTLHRKHSSQQAGDGFCYCQAPRSRRVATCCPALSDQQQKAP
jgi:hypothetical protein